MSGEYVRHGYPGEQAYSAQSYPQSVVYPQSYPLPLQQGHPQHQRNYSQPSHVQHPQLQPHVTYSDQSQSRPAPYPARSVGFTPAHPAPIVTNPYYPALPTVNSPSYQPPPMTYHSHSTSPTRRPLPAPKPRPESMPPPIISHSHFPARPPQNYPTSSFPTSSFSVSTTNVTPPQSSSSSPTRSGYVSPTNSSPSRSGRPLPTPSSRHGSLGSTKGVTGPFNSTGTTSQTKRQDITALISSSTSDPLLPSNDKGSKFVPLWKRDRAKFNTGQSQGSTCERVERTSTILTSNADGNSARPLPTSPTYTPAPPQSTISPWKSRTLPTPVHSDSDSDGSVDVDPPSPQYGIRDLPPRSQGVGKLYQSSGPSVASRMAALALDGSKPATSRIDSRSISWNTSAATTTPSHLSSPTKRSLPPTKGPGTVWPSGIAQLPNSHQIVGVNGKGKEREYVDLDDEPPPSLRSPSPRMQTKHLPLTRSQPSNPHPHPQTQPQPRWKPPISAAATLTATAPKIESPAPVGGRDKRPDIPKISFPAGHDDGSDSDSDDWQAESKGPSITISQAPSISVSQAPSISVSQAPDTSLPGPRPGPEISIAGTSSPTKRNLPALPPKPLQRGNGLICGGCGGAIIGRIVNAMDVRWHPGCFRCSVCHELLEHVSSYEWEGRPYCHLDYHENFAPRCYSCKTAIIDERFITLDDEALGKRTYHEQHFFCAECGDPFLAPTGSNPRTGGQGGLTVTGDGSFSEDDVGFTVYKGHPYCEACHVRLRLPKCKRCKKSIRDGARAVEALGGKWCWECFVCSGCEKPFEDPSFFQRNEKPFCEQCFSIILRNEL